MSEVIANYSERRFDGSRLFELYPDGVAISGGHSLGPRFEQKVPLEGLSPVPDKMWARPGGFWGGIWMLIIFAAIPLGFRGVLPAQGQGLFWVLATGGALLALATSRRVEWAIYRNASGTPLLSIAKSDNNAMEFQKFIDALNNAISRAKSAA